MDKNDAFQLHCPRTWTGEPAMMQDQCDVGQTFALTEVIKDSNETQQHSITSQLGESTVLTSQVLTPQTSVMK